MEQIRRIMRPTDVPDTGLLCDLLWSDPDKDVQGWGENDRGVSFTFGADVVSKFLNRHDLDLICRAHQVVEDGYEFFAKRQLVTLFSAPNYCGEFDNAGGMMSVDETLMCSFQVTNCFDLIRRTFSFMFPSDFEAVRKESEIPIRRIEFRATCYSSAWTGEKKINNLICTFIQVIHVVLGAINIYGVFYGLYSTLLQI